MGIINHNRIMSILCKSILFAMCHCFVMPPSNRNRLDNLLPYRWFRPFNEERQEYAIDIARDNKAQLFALTVLDISKITYAASAFIASPMNGLDKLERNRKKTQGWLDKVGKLTSEKI